ncbi:hypothetical protein SDC9_40504 [bioreactor metagenome]|uniref:Uncharacterized protein n=1 Tax=bioreactor metagenome TaxID=1076179 RepID=A0A644VSH3_9ZZZZ
MLQPGHSLVGACVLRPATQRDRALGGQAQQPLERGIVDHEIGERAAVERGIEGFERLAEGHAEQAGLAQRAGVRRGVEAFGEGQRGLEGAQHLADADLGHRPRQPQPARAATLGLDEAALREGVDDLREVVFRGVAGGGDLVLAHDPAGIDRAAHQRAHGQVGSRRQSHGKALCSASHRRNRAGAI